jgi:hypothetical protein
MHWPIEIETMVMAGHAAGSAFMSPRGGDILVMGQVISRDPITLTTIRLKSSQCLLRRRYIFSRMSHRLRQHHKTITGITAEIHRVITPM